MIIIAACKTSMFTYKLISLRLVTYGIDLMQRRTRTRVIGHHSPGAPIRLSMSFNGLVLELERKPQVSS